MRLSRTAAYAVQATLQLAQTSPGAPVPCSQLASEGKMPQRFLLQILRNLVTHGILQSTRGVEGGYALTRDADHISLLEVIEAVDGPMRSNSTEAGEPLPADTSARLHQALEEVTASTRRELESIKLAHLIPQPPA